jgi:AcrR family transcriptional regulator
MGSDPKAPKTTQELRTRDRLLQVAAEMFADRGFKKVTIREISAAAQANVAAVNYHFGDKDGLYRAVVQRALQAMRETNDLSIEAGRGTPPEMQLRAYIRVLLSRLTGTDRLSWIHRLMSREMEGPSEVTRLVLREVLEPRMRHLSAIVGEIAELPPDDPRVMRAVLSIQGQILLFGRPILPRTPQRWSRLLADSTVAADHIASFSIAAIRNLAAVPA